MKNVLRIFTAAISILSLLGAAQAQTTIAEWNFNANPGPANASTGTGLVEGLFVPIGGGFGPATGVNVGSPADTNTVLVGGVANNSVAGRSGPNPGEAFGPVDGVRNLTVTTSTLGYKDITISFNALQGYRASRYHQIYATTDGVTFSPVPLGQGSAATTLGSATLAPNGNPQTTQSATISNTGLVSIITADNMIPDPATGDAFVYDLTYTFPSGSAFENNPNFAFKIGAVPVGGDYVSSFAGTSAIDTDKGYIRSTSAGGNVTLYDLVNVSGSVVPEPAAGLPLALAGLWLIGLIRCRNRR